jgi:hypothetical protein
MSEFEAESKVLGSMPASAALDRLSSIDDPDAALLREALKGVDSQGLTLDRALNLHWHGDHAPPVWMNSSTAYGYIAPEDQQADQAAITDARHVTADEKLKKGRIDVHISQFHVESYPGGDQTHRVLLTFEGKNALPHDVEQLAFNMTVDVREGQDAPIANWPIFVGLNVSNSGVGFHFTTTNVANLEDHKILDFLNSPTFTSGLKLAETAQPAIKPLTDIALGLGKTFLTRSDNQKVQEVYLGLDFAHDPGGVRLAQGNYIVAQIPDGVEVDWSAWKFKNGDIRAPDGYDTQFPYNYLVFSVSAYEGD